MKGYVHARGGFVAKNMKSYGSGIKPALHKRHDETHDPNLEILKESLHQLSIKGVRNKQKPALGGSVAERPKKQRKYIIF